MEPREILTWEANKSNHIYDFIGVWSLSAAYAAIYLNLEHMGSRGASVDQPPRASGREALPEPLQGANQPLEAGWQSSLPETFWGVLKGPGVKGYASLIFPIFVSREQNSEKTSIFLCVFFTQIKPRLGSPLHLSSPTSGESLEELVAAWRSHPS